MQMKSVQLSKSKIILIIFSLMVMISGLVLNGINSSNLVSFIQNRETNIIQHQNITRYALASLCIIFGSIVLLSFNLKQLIKYESEYIELKSESETQIQTKSRFLSNMSHEIRSPLTCIMGFTDIIDRIETDPEKKKYLQAIKTSSDHLLNTVNDILDFSKLDAGKLQLSFQPFNINEVIQEIAFAFGAIAAEKGIIIKEEISLSNDLIVIGDKFRLKQILYNLTSNAIKFTNKGYVVITADAHFKSDKEADIKIQVADSGIGIPSTHLKSIFDEFSQVKSSIPLTEQRRSITGTGLGLPICKMLVELQGGRIHVASKLNEGAVFSILLSYPVQNNFIEEVESPSVYVSPKVKQLYAGKKALIIEDNEMNAMLLSLLLKKQKLKFDVARNGKLGWELFNENIYDIILTDINVPEMTGDQLAAAIRKAPNAKSKMPVIALTASIVKDDLEDYRKSGISDILLKPFKEDELNSLLQKHIFPEI
jgi:signal transduction histidine kinase/CheY-like chemotaxis protein